ncbi:MAG: zinc-binding alcohol dehydrogenase, partial [Bacteroidota bacterium]
MLSQQLWHTSPTKTEIRSVEIEQDNDLLLCKGLYSLISIGTENLVASGKVPFQMFESMRVPYMQGDFGLPVNYGYSMIASVQHPENDSSKLAHVMHPHCNSFYAKSGDLFYLDEDTNLVAATFIANMETAINAIWDSQVQVGDKVLICGYGVIGALIAEILNSMPGIQVTILELNDARKQIAFQKSFNTELESDYDVCFNCTAHEDALQICIDHSAYESKIIELSWYGIKAVNVNIGMDFHIKRKQIISSQVSHIPSFKSARWDYKRRKALAYHFTQTLDLAFLQKHIIPFKESPSTF